jgi:TRAP-type C4-dicarboxylate transport system permease large subunit
MQVVYAHAALVLAVMAAGFVVGMALKAGSELSLFIAALAGAVVHDVGVPVRHLAEGTFTYFDVVLIFVTATFFMNLVRESGGINLIVRGIITRFHSNRFILLLLLALIMLIPGALTGSGTVTVMVVGSFVGTVLGYLGISPSRAAAIVFMGASMSAAAPPVNLWAMMTAAGANMPYVGFTMPLAIISIAGSLFSTFYLGWQRGNRGIDVDRALREIPKPPLGMTGRHVAVPFAILFGIIGAGRLWPHHMPVIGLPLAFSLAAISVIAMSPTKLSPRQILSNTLKGLLPVVSTITIVGILVQIMTLSGVRGLISLSVVTLPLAVLLAVLWLILPVSEAIFQYAAAPLLGVPLVFLFNMEGLNLVMAVAGMACIWPLGDCLPPTAPVGRASVLAVGYEGDYKKFLAHCIIPALFVMALATAYIIFSSRLSFLVRG